MKQGSARPTTSGCSEEGQAMVEFMLSLVIVMFFIFAIFETMTMLYSYNVIANAAKEGVRYAVVSGSNSATPAGPTTGTGSNCTTNVVPVQNYVSNYAGLTFHNMSGLTVNVCYLDGTNAPPNRVQVTVQYTYMPYFNVPLTPPIYAAAEGRIVN